MFQSMPAPTASPIVTTTSAARALVRSASRPNSGAVALLALVLEECFGAARIGSLLGGIMFFCMGATLLANQWTAGVFDRDGSYLFAWQTYTVLMMLTLVPVVWLWRRGTPTLAQSG